MQSTTHPPRPPRAEPSDLALVERALRRLAALTRYGATTDLTDPATRVHYHIVRARAIALESLGRVPR